MALVYKFMTASRFYSSINEFWKHYLKVGKEKCAIGSPMGYAFIDYEHGRVEILPEIKIENQNKKEFTI
jgi:hypothetical protein